MKKKLIQATCLFFVMMLIFTILSRVSDSVNVIQIQTKNPANQIITHEVKGSGKVDHPVVANLLSVANSSVVRHCISR